MKFSLFRSILCGLLFLALSPLSRAEGEPVRLAIAGTPEVPALNDLITADLTANPGFALVERAKLDKVASEFKLGSLGYAEALKLGSQLGARGVLVIDGMAAGDNQWRLSARLVDTRTGVIVWSETLGFPLDSGEPRIPDLPGLATRLASAVIACRDRLAAAPGALVPVSFLNLKSVFSSWGARAIDRDLNTLVMGYLEHDPSICILERQALDLAAWEKSVNAADASPFWTGRVVVSGAVETAATDATQLVVRLKIQKAGGVHDLDPLHGTRDALPALAKAIADTIAAAAVPNGAPVPPVEPAAEAKEAADAAWQAADGRADWRIASGLARSAWVFSSGDKQYLGLYIRSLGWIASAACYATRDPANDMYIFTSPWIGKQVTINQIALDSEPELVGEQFDAAIEATTLLIDRKADITDDYIPLACEIQGRSAALLVAASQLPNRKDFDDQRIELQTKIAQLAKAILSTEIISDGHMNTAEFLTNHQEWSEYLDGGRDEWVADMKQIMSIPIERFTYHFGGLASDRDTFCEWPWNYDNGEGWGYQPEAPPRPLALAWTADPEGEARKALNDLAAWLPSCSQPEGRLMGIKLKVRAGDTQGAWDVVLQSIPGVLANQISSHPILNILDSLEQAGNVPAEPAFQLLEETVKGYRNYKFDANNSWFLNGATNTIAPKLSDAMRRQLLTDYASAAHEATKADSALILDAMSRIPPPTEPQASPTPGHRPRPPALFLGTPVYAPPDPLTETSLSAIWFKWPRSLIAGGKYWFIEYPDLALVGIWPGQPVERIPFPAPRTDEEITWLGAVTPVAASDRWIVLESQHVAADWSLLIYDRVAHAWHRGTKFPAASFVKDAVIDGDMLYFKALDRRNKAGKPAWYEGECLFLRLKLPGGAPEILASQATDLTAITKNPPHTDMVRFGVHDGKVFLASSDPAFSLDLKTLEWNPISKAAFDQALPPAPPTEEFGSLELDFDQMLPSKLTYPPDQKYGFVLTFPSSRDGSQVCLITDPGADFLFKTGDIVALKSDNKIWFVKRSDMEAKAWKLKAQ